MPFDRIESQPFGDELLKQRAEQIFSAISEASQSGTSTPHVDSLTVSMGVVLISPSDLLPESVCSRDSEALKQAKTEGKITCVACIRFIGFKFSPLAKLLTLFRLIFHSVD